jgi:hypothetical protein
MSNVIQRHFPFGYPKQCDFLDDMIVEYKDKFNLLPEEGAVFFMTPVYLQTIETYFENSTANILCINEEGMRFYKGVPIVTNEESNRMILLGTPGAIVKEFTSDDCEGLYG